MSANSQLISTTGHICSDLLTDLLEHSPTCSVLLQTVCPSDSEPTPPCFYQTLFYPNLHWYTVLDLMPMFVVFELATPHFVLVDKCRLQQLIPVILINRICTFDIEITWKLIETLCALKRRLSFLVQYAYSFFQIS